MLLIFGFIVGKFSFRFSFLIHYVRLSMNGALIFKTTLLYNKRYAVKNINLKSGGTFDDFSLFLSDNTSNRISKNTYFNELLSKSKWNPFQWCTFLFELSQTLVAYFFINIGSSAGIYRGYLLSNLISVLHLNIYLNATKMWQRVQT